MYIGEVWLPITKTGTGATITVRLETNLVTTISGTDYNLPSGTLAHPTASTTIATTAQNTDGKWIRAVFATPPFLDDGTWSITPPIAFSKTQYHLVVSVAADSATNYVNWIGDTDESFGLGISGLYGGATWANVDTAMLFRFGLTDDEKDWKRIGKNEWRVLPESTKRIHVRPETGVWLPTPVKLIGQGVQTSLEGTTNEGTTCTVDPELITSLAIGFYTEMKAVQNKNTQELQMGIAMKREAMERLAALRPLLRGRKVERQ
jgi:hypothetical protein